MSRCSEAVFTKERALLALGNVHAGCDGRIGESRRAADDLKPLATLTYHASSGSGRGVAHSLGVYKHDRREKFLPSTGGRCRGLQSAPDRAHFGHTWSTEHGRRARARRKPQEKQYRNKVGA
jgi:hypothetical protein